MAREHAAHTGRDVLAESIRLKSKFPHLGCYPSKLRLYDTINRYAAGGGAPLATITDGVGGAIFNTLSGYDIAIGFDGNLYATANPSSGNACVLKINVATNTLDSTFVSASGGVHLAKTLHFDPFSAGAAAPEPGTLALGALGLMGLVVVRRRKH